MECPCSPAPSLFLGGGGGGGVWYLCFKGGGGAGGAATKERLSLTKESRVAIYRLYIFSLLATCVRSIEQPCTASDGSKALKLVCCC